MDMQISCELEEYNILWSHIYMLPHYDSFILMKPTIFFLTIRRMSADQEGFERGGYQSVGIEGAAFIHPNSALFKTMPDYVVYQEIIETTKPYMRGQLCYSLSP